MNESHLFFFPSAKIKRADGNNNPLNKLTANRKTSETVGKMKPPHCDLTNNDAAATSTLVYYSIHKT